MTRDVYEHRCPVSACAATVPDSLLMCRAHWRGVPTDLQQAVYRAYKRGKGLGSEELLAAQRAAIASVEENVWKKPPEPGDGIHAGSAGRPARRAGDQWNCECGEKIVGALTVNKKVAPVVLRPSDDGNVWLGRNAEGVVVCATLGGPLLDKAREVGMQLHLNHFSDCPLREKFER